jgi:hypothetical protein
MPIKQHGGGEWDETCKLCMLPFNIPYYVYEEPSTSKLRNVNLSWLEKGLGFDEKTHKIMNIENYNSFGKFYIEDVSDKKFTSNQLISWENADDNAYGPVFHKDCINFIEKQLKKPITYDYGVQIYENVKDSPDGGQFYGGGQFYDWEKAVKKEGTAYFNSPMDKNGAKTRKRINSRLSAWLAEKKLAKRVSKKKSKWNAEFAFQNKELSGCLSTNKCGKKKSKK